MLSSSPTNSLDSEVAFITREQEQAAIADQQPECSGDNSTQNQWVRCNNRTSDDHYVNSMTGATGTQQVNRRQNPQFNNDSGVANLSDKDCHNFRANGAQSNNEECEYRSGFDPLSDDQGSLLHVDIHSQNGMNSLESISPSMSSSTSSNNISEYSAAFLIINAALGAGLLNFPLAFHQAGGIIPGNSVHLFFLAATLGSLYIMSHTASRSDSKTYQEMVQHQCGEMAAHLTSACIAVYCLITCITFIIIVGDQTDRFFANIIGPNFCDIWAFNRMFTMTAAGLIVLALSFYKDMAKLVSIGYVGNVFILYLIAVIVYVWGYGGYTPGRVVMFDKNEFARMFDVLPTISFGYQCHVSSVPIYYSIANRNRKKYFKACALAMICCAVVYSVAANFGYLTFGSKVADDILLSYDNEHTGAMAVNIAVIALAFKSVTTYPVLMFCVREAVVSFYVSARGMTPAEIVITEPRRRYVVVLLLWLTSIAAAIVATNISVVVRLLGSLAAFFIFLIPGICLFVHCNELDALQQNGSSGSHHSKVKLNLVRVASITYILLGVFTFGLSVTLAAQSILYPSSEDFGPLCVVGENNTSFFLHLQSAASSSHHHLSLLHASYQK